MRVEPLDAPFGARVTLEREEPLGARERAEIQRLYARHGLVVLQGASLSPAHQLELLDGLGRIEPDPAGGPLLMEVTNQHARSAAPPGELAFHYDYAYDPSPVRTISMYGERVAEGATPTRFASSATVLERLPRAVVERLRRSVASHACFLFRPDAPGVRSEEPDPIIPRGQPGWGPDHYWTRHPAIFANAFGVETLFLCEQHTDRIHGVSRAESDALLEEIFAAMYAPDQIYDHAWREGDLVMWDNWTVQHARPEPNDLPRHLRRYHVADDDRTELYLRVGREHGFV